MKRVINGVNNPLVFFLWLVLTVVSFVFLDRTVATFFHRDTPHWLHEIAGFITWFGWGGDYLAFFAILWLVGHFVLKQQRTIEIGRFLLVSTLASGIFCDLLKVILGRSRPVLFFKDHDYGFYFFKFHVQFWSFPSGHTMFITSVMVSLALIWPKYRWFCFAGVLLVALSRVILTAHYMSDVWMGMYLGTFVSVAVYELFVQQKWLPETINNVEEK